MRRMLNAALLLDGIVVSVTASLSTSPARWTQRKTILSVHGLP